MTVADHGTFRDVQIEGVLETTEGRLREIQAILFAIEAGELLSQLPEGPARDRHIAGVCLLEVMSREVSTLVLDLDRLSACTAGTSALN